MLKKIKTNAFWIGLSSAVVILIDSLNEAFNWCIPSGSIEKIILAVCGVLVVMGFVTKDSTVPKDENDKNQSEIDVDNKK